MRTKREPQARAAWGNRMFMRLPIAPDPSYSRNSVAETLGLASRAPRIREKATLSITKQENYDESTKKLCFDGRRFRGVGNGVGVFSVGPAIAQTVRAALVSNVDDPGRIPYQILGSCFFSGTTDCHSNLPPVPARMRLVITQVSGYVQENLPGGTFIAPVLSGGKGRIQIPVAFQGSASGLNYFSFNQVDTMFVDAGQSPRVEFFLGAIPSQNSGVEFTLTGYMLDCMTGPCAAIAP